MTVREAFEKAYGPIPEGATCHIGFRSEKEDACYRMPTITREGVFPWVWFQGRWDPTGDWPDEVSDGPNIADRQAHWFLGFFGAEYDRVVAEDQAAWRAALHGARVSVSDAEDDGA